MKNLIIAFIFFSSSSISIYCADILLVNNIYFEGLQRVTVGAMLLSMPVRIGNIATDENIRNTIRTLFYTGKFEDIRVLIDKDSLIIQVKERPTIASISFLGNKEVKDEFLKNKLDAEGIMVGEVLNRTTIANIEMEIENFYCSIGKYRAMVKTIVTLLPCNMVDLKIVLIEGESAIIQQINIVGNNVLTTNELISNFKLHNKATLWNVDNKYNKNKISIYIKILRNLYLDIGYACFDIFSTNVNITPDKKSIYITININEGAKYKFYDIVVNFNIAISNYKEVIKLAKIIPGELYNRSKVKKIEKDIKQLLGSYGYKYTNVLKKYEINYIDKKINLYINIDTGKNLYVRYIKFLGNNITKDLVLRSEIQHMEGTLLSSNLVDKGRERLNSIGYFNVVDTNIIMVNGSLDHVDVIYKVKEHNIRSINAGIGLGTESGISFKYSIQKDNLFGTGNLVALNGTRNNYKTYTEFYIKDPYIIDGISLSSKIFYKYFKADGVYISDYDLRIYSFCSTIGFTINDNKILSIGIDYVHNYINNIIKNKVVMLPYLKVNGIIDKNNIFYTNKVEKYSLSTDDLFFTIGWCSNKLDNYDFPNAGYRVSFLGKVTLPYSKSEYYKITFDIHNYINFKKKFIFMVRASVGYIAGLCSKKVPFLDKFYASSTNTVRGFNSNNIKSNIFNSSAYLLASNGPVLEGSIDAVGGNDAMTIVSAEVIFPTPFLIEQYANSVRTSFFIDAGTVLDTYLHNKKNNIEFNRATGIPDYSDTNNNIRVSCGISVKWMSPIGPIVLSYAQPIKTYTGDKSEQFQFNIGK